MEDAERMSLVLGKRIILPRADGQHRGQTTAVATWKICSLHSTGSYAPAVSGQKSNIYFQYLPVLSHVCSIDNI